MPDIIVKNQAELDAALKAATGGETIKLLAGTYSSVKLTNKNYASNVTITSADPNNEATIQRVDLSSSSNITFKSLNLARTIAPPEADYTQLHNVSGSSNITFDSVRISGGSGDASKSLGWGIFFRGGSNITVMNSTIDHMSMGMNLTEVDGMVLKNNTFTDNRRDGLNLSAITNGVIDGNLFTNMHPVNGEHPDAIQFLTRGMTKGSSNIVIKNNVVMQGNGEPIQGIFLGEETGKLPYTNVDITNNLVYVNGMYNGINVANASNLNITNNTIVSRTDDAINAWIRVERVNGGTISGNIGDQLVLGSAVNNVSVGNNNWLKTDSAVVRALTSLNAGANAKLSGMIVPNIGYQPPAGSAAAKIVAAEIAASKPAPTKNLLLDLEFNATGLTETSRFNSVATSTIDPSAISNGSYHVQTNKGFEISRNNSVQLFGLPAFTLTFDLQRDSATAPTGQVMGVFQSWSVVLQSNGELNFTIKNDAGTTYSIVTQGAKLVDTNNHKIGVTFDGASGRATIYVDNVAKGTGAVSGSSKGLESWGLYVGYQFGAAFSGRIGNIEMRDQALSAAQIATLSTASDFGSMKKPTSLAGLVGQLVSGSQSPAAAAIPASNSSGQSVMGEIVSAVAAVAAPAPVAAGSPALTKAPPLAAGSLALTKATMFRAEYLDLYVN